MKVITLKNGNKATVGVFMRKVAKELAPNDVKKQNTLFHEMSNIYHEKGFEDLKKHIEKLSK